MSEWWQIKDYPNYEVSKEGQVRNKITGKILKQRLSNTGYYRVCLYNENNHKFFSVHRLVASAFIENPYNKSCVNHIDNNPKNNNVENLEWVSYKENMQWASVQGRMDFDDKRKQEHRESLRKIMKPVIGTDKNGKKYYFDSIREADKYGFTSKHISDCCKGRRKTVNGLKWEYAEKEKENV